MKGVFNVSTLKVPVKLWIEWEDHCEYPNGDLEFVYGIEESARNQIVHLACLPFAFHHVAIMPDCHAGYGMPIGGVLATEGVVIPNAVGVDIGCGMCAVKTSLKVDQLDKGTLERIVGKIREVIPVGFEHYKEDQPESFMPEYGGLTGIKDGVVIKEYKSALRQLGTLGGGNHFIEIQKDTNDNVWIMIHSGSRNLGFKVAEHYNLLAYNLNKRWHSNTYLPTNPKDSLAFLPIESQEAKDYMTEMQYCVDFALANRKLMMDRIIQIFVHENLFYQNFNGLQDTRNSFINIAHNYAQWENHFGKNVIVHRKGATLAREGTTGIIPGSQGSKSYIVKGKGNKDSFESCSHGAGRKMGRNEACKKLDLATEQKILDDQGIIHGLCDVDNLDEATGAYKDIDEVMKNQEDLVEIVETLHPLAVIKGG